MKRILVYGDSNTWGYIAGTACNENPFGKRYAKNERWPGILQEILGNDYLIIEEGMPGRTIATDNLSQPGINGLTYLKSNLAKHELLHGFVLMLGTNDLNREYKLEIVEIVEHMQCMIEFIQSSLKPNLPIFLIVPPTIKTEYLNEELRIAYSDIDSDSMQLPNLFATLSKNYGCIFIDSNIQSLSLAQDGLHLDCVGHRKLAYWVSSYIFKYFGESDLK